MTERIDDNDMLESLLWNLRWYATKWLSMVAAVILYGVSFAIAASLPIVALWRLLTHYTAESDWLFSRKE